VYWGHGGALAGELNRVTRDPIEKSI
jgi:hypothetical protein